MASLWHLNIWTVSIGLLMVVSGAIAAVPKRPVDVPFGRNYVPTWAFDHIKYLNGGSEIQLVLDKQTGLFHLYTFLALPCILEDAEYYPDLYSCSIGFILIRYWISVQGFLSVWTLQYAHQDGWW